MNTVKMRGRNGGTDFMVRIPKFKLSDVLDGASDAVHPAFIVGGKEVDEIYISKYQNSIHNRLALQSALSESRNPYQLCRRGEGLRIKGQRLALDVKC